jgi:LysR family transcriptional regulator, hydrogen peroxide-inducible genes activator
MTPLPSLRQLRHFAALAEHRHFGRAAQACSVTQSTLSASVAELEALLAVPLVDRTTRRVMLTPMGESLVERARQILEATETLVREAAAAREPLSGALRLGVIPTIGPFLLPRILPRLRRAYPKLRLYLTEDLTDRLLESLHAGRLDAALLALPYDCGAVDTALLWDDPFSLVYRPPAEGEPSPSLGDRLDPSNLLLLRDGHCLKDHALAACKAGTPKPLDAFEATSLHTLVQMVDNGLGSTLLPQIAIDAGILKGTSLMHTPLTKGAPPRRIALVWRRGSGRAAEFRLLAEKIEALARPRQAPEASKAFKPAR